MTSGKSNKTVVNFADFIPDIALRLGDKKAILFPQWHNTDGSVNYKQLSFSELDSDINAYARGFLKIGVLQKMRVCFMVKPSLEFLPLTFALFRVGAVPVFIDPGMGKNNLLRCIEAAQPDAFIGIPRAQIAKLFFSSYFKSVKINVTIGWRLFWGGYNLRSIHVKKGEAVKSSNQLDDLAAIIYTTGSTGPPKGVEYTHRMFIAQRNLLAKSFNLTEDDIDMPTFALFSILTLSLGCKIVIPDMDQTRPAEVRPQNIINAIKQNRVSFSFGSPALWNTVSLACQKEKISFSSLKHVLMAGAPIPPYLHKRMLKKIINKGEIHTPYGSTEALPVSSFTGTKVLEETADLTAAGKGYCVGQALEGVDIRIIDVNDEIIKYWDDVTILDQGKIGEIVVKGDIVSRRYFQLEDKTAEHKIYETADNNGAFWHRIGDLGYLDSSYRLWMCGRKTHRIETGNERLYTVCCEAIYNQHKDVFRSAIVGLGDDRYKQIAVAIIEPVKGKVFLDNDDRISFTQEIKKLGQNNMLTQAIKTILIHPSFPVDIRHNAKIFREKLAVWAAKELD